MQAITKKMTLRERQVKFVYNISLLIQYALKMGIELTAGEFYRPPATQAYYFKQGLSKTKTGRHPLRLAADFNFFVNGRMLFEKKENYGKDVLLVKPLGEFWLSLHTDNVWGADWNRNHEVMDESFHDPYHFEMKN